MSLRRASGGGPGGAAPSSAESRRRLGLGVWVLWATVWSCRCHGPLTQRFGHRLLPGLSFRRHLCPVCQAWCRRPAVPQAASAPGGCGPV